MGGGVVSSFADPVVVGMDGSTCSIGALRWATDEAAWRQRALRVVHAVGSADPHSYGPGQDLVDEAIVQARAWQPQLEITGLVYDGQPAAELCAESAHAELVVVGSHGRGGFA